MQKMLALYQKMGREIIKQYEFKKFKNPIQKNMLKYKSDYLYSRQFFILFAFLKVFSISALLYKAGKTDKIAFKKPGGGNQKEIYQNTIQKVFSEQIREIYMKQYFYFIDFLLCHYIFPVIS